MFSSPSQTYLTLQRAWTGTAAEDFTAEDAGVRRDRTKDMIFFFLNRSSLVTRAFNPRGLRPALAGVQTAPAFLCEPLRPPRCVT